MENLPVIIKSKKAAISARIYDLNNVMSTNWQASIV